MIENQIAILISALSLCVAIAVFIRSWVKDGSEKIRLTQNLHEYFNSKEMLVSRENTWFFLEGLEDFKNYPSFEQIWRDKDKAQNFRDMYRVLSFWQQLEVLYKRGLLDNEVTYKLFEYERNEWSKQIRPLVVATNLIDQKYPEVLQPFDVNQGLELTNQSTTCLWRRRP